jgi:trans-aconitate methyltransferase
VLTAMRAQTDMTKLLQLPNRVIRHLFLDGSYERYYSPEVWDRKYDGGYDLNAPAEDGRYGALLAVLRRFEGRHPILDAGCGDGLLEQQLSRFSDSRIIGIDYSQSAIDAATARGLPNCEFVCSDYRSFHPQERFSIVLFNEALYYVEDYLATVEHLSGFLAEGGVLVVSMFETRVTSRIWKALKGRYRFLQGAAVQDETSGTRWRIRVLQPSRVVS